MPAVVILVGFATCAMAKFDGAMHRVYGASASAQAHVPSGLLSQTASAASTPKHQQMHTVAKDASPLFSPRKSRTDGDYQKTYAASAYAPEPALLDRAHWGQPGPAGTGVNNQLHNSNVANLERAWNSPPASPRSPNYDMKTLITRPLDGGFHKEYAAFTGKATNPSPGSVISDGRATKPSPDVQIPWLPVPKSPEPRFATEQTIQSNPADMKAMAKMNDGGHHKAYATFGGKTTNPNPVSSVSTFIDEFPRPSKGRTSWLPEIQLGGKATNPSSVSSVSNVRTSWLPQVKSAPMSPEPQNSDRASWLPEVKSAPKSPEPQTSAGLNPPESQYPQYPAGGDVRATRKMDGGYQKAYAAYGAKATNPSPLSSVSHVRTPSNNKHVHWAPSIAEIKSVPKSREPQYPARQNNVGDSKTTQQIDGAFHKAYSASGAKATNPRPLSSGSDVQIPWLPESKSPEPQYQASPAALAALEAVSRRQNTPNAQPHWSPAGLNVDGGYHKTYTASAGRATNPSPVSSGSDVQMPWIPEPMSPEPQYQARQNIPNAQPMAQYQARQNIPNAQPMAKMDGGFHKAYAAYGAKAANPSPGSTVSGIQRLRSEPGLQRNWQRITSDQDAPAHPNLPEYANDAQLKDALWQSYWQDLSAKDAKPSPVSSVSDSKPSGMTRFFRKFFTGDENKRIRDQFNNKANLERSYAASNQPVMRGYAEPHSKYFTGLFVVASFVLVVVGLKKLRSFQKPVHCQDAFLYTQMN